MGLEFLKAIDEKEELLKAAADFVWDHPELAYQEYESAAYLCELLRNEGFQVKTPLAGIQTAFSATYGSGSPVIGVLGEFDALSGMQQEAGVTYKSSNNGVGHGCGHNLLGACSIGAAIGIKAFLEQTKTQGTVIFFGCPAEEGGSAKTFMARDGVFDGVDAALCMHPATITGIRNTKTLANTQMLFKFDGRSAHASILPHLGRSALDAVELMNVGVNYLREHIISDARVHYALTDAGGCSPNVVQAHAEVLYLIRAPKNEQVKHILDRVIKIAEGAALMTETTVTPVFVKACSNTVLNHTIQQVMYEKMAQIGVPQMSEEEKAFAQKMASEGLTEYATADPDHPVHYELMEYIGDEEEGMGSTDVGDVSWVCPTAQARAAMYAYGTPNHSWQQTAQGKWSWAHKMMIYVSKTLCATGVELIRDPQFLARAKEEFAQRTGPDGYCCPIPEGVVPNSVKLPR